MSRVRTSLCLLFVSAGLAAPAFAQTGSSASVVIQVKPPAANILIDGVKWAASDPSQALTVQLAPGSHHIEISAPGMQTFTRDLTLRAGESVPLNVMLSAAEPSSTPRPRVSPPPQGQEPPPPPRPRVPAPQAPPPQPSSGQNIHFTPGDDGFMAAPDVRFTEINGRAATLVGAYAGMTYGGKFFVGAGGYFQVDGYNGSQMNYFGPVFEYRYFENKTFGVNLHALIGGGVTYGGCCYPVYPGPHYGYVYGYNEAFFVFEPEVQAVIRFSPIVRLQAGIGYRVTSGYNHDGVSGSIALQIGR